MENTIRKNSIFFNYLTFYWGFYFYGAGYFALKKLSEVKYFLRKTIFYKTVV